MSVTLPQKGEYFEGKYLIEDHIGSGGFAEVYLARDVNGRQVAIKMLVPGQQEWQQQAGEKLIERFEREGELLGRLTNEHTVKMLEMGRNRDGLPYIVFEYVDGTDLAEVVDLHGALPPARVVTILQQVCSALKEAHDLGVMHRDIKPANIMVYQHLGIQGLVKLLDFGIAKPQASEDSSASGSSLTTAGMVLGTPRYMAPEQFTGAKLAPTSDIYSLGLVAYELLVGKAAVDAQTTTGIFRQQLSPSEFKIPRDADVPAGLRRIIEKMTKKSRSQRYQTMDEILVDLEEWDSGLDTQQFVQYGASALVVALLVVIGISLLGGNEQRANRATPTSGVSQQVQRGERLGAPTRPTTPQRIEKGPATKTKTAGPADNREVPAANKPSVERTAVPTKPPEKDDNDEAQKEPQVAPPNPESDDIEPLDLASAAEAKVVASSAYTVADWRRVIAACKPYGQELTFCARMLAEGYKNLGDVNRACQWFDLLGEIKHGLDCE